MRKAFFKRLALALLLVAAGGARAADSIHIGSAGSAGGDLTSEQLQTQLADEAKPVQYKSKGAEHTFTCVPLLSVLKAGGVETDFVMKPGADPKTKNPQMRRVVIVTGKDGYAVVFSMPELLPAVGNRAVWVALQEDGQPLSSSDGPVRLIVPDDRMPSRNVHEIASIEVVDVSAPATQPSMP